DTLPYIEQWFADFSLTDPSGRQPVVSITGSDPAVEITVGDEPVLLGYQSIRALTELDADKFNRYIEEEGIEFIREARIQAGEDEEPASEYFIRCAKTLISPIRKSGFLSRLLRSSKADESVYKSRLGYTLELIPLENPADKQTGDTLTFELLYREKPAEGLLIQAFTREMPEQIEKIRTDSNGRGTINLDRSGTWFVKAVNIQSIIGNPNATWQSYWASYLFSVD
ncbi:MAG: DUF4198 domain-containing protein, partial [Gammaproteobacteria bacterium]